MSFIQSDFGDWDKGERCDSNSGPVVLGEMGARLTIRLPLPVPSPTSALYDWDVLLQPAVATDYCGAVWSPPHAWRMTSPKHEMMKA